jgi:hypothetical protein
MQAATKDEHNRLADLAGTTVGTLHQIAGSYRNDGVPTVRSGLAGRLQSATANLRKKNKTLPVVLRTDLSPECRECEFAQRCLGTLAVAGEFQSMSDEG